MPNDMSIKTDFDVELSESQPLTPRRVTNSIWKYIGISVLVVLVVGGIVIGALFGAHVLPPQVLDIIQHIFINLINSKY